ncbi:MAG: beta-lactamase family protein [Deltaproteobacteria bacterium]|nr:beta-lactamase family protein [Deltaproteobacteria bacterium]
MKKLFSIFIGCFLLVGLLAGCAMDSPRIKGYKDVVPEDYGLSSKKLYQLSENLQTDVSNEIIPGAVALIARKGKIVYFENFGMQVKAKGIPMARNSIFRIYSMTKPIVGVAILLLHEKGKLDISDPVSKYLPEFRNMKVGIIEDGKIKDTVPVQREITIKDLLMHTSGLTYGVFGSSPIKDMYLDAEIDSRNQTLKVMTKRLGRIPLMFQPGIRWEYSRSFEVLGRLVEVVSGMTLDRFLESHIFRPLGMQDTGFYVKKMNLERIAEHAENELMDVTRRPVKLAGGGGLVSTAEDYYRFVKMLLNNGALNNSRFLKEQTAKLITTDHMEKLPEWNDPKYLPGKGYGFGLSVAVRIKKSGWKEGTIGDFWWGGAAGTYFWVDPENELIAILMIQSPERRMYYRPRFREWVYNAVTN